MKLLIMSLLLVATNTIAASKELTVYTSRKEHLIKDIFKQYEKESGVKIKYKTGKEGALIQNMKSEAKSPVADIFMTVDAGNLWYAKKEELLQRVDSKILNKNVPAHLRDRNNEWFGLSIRARTTVINPKFVKDFTNITYEELATPKWKGKLCLRTSKKVYNQSLVAMLIFEHGYDEAKKIVAGWTKNAVEIFSSDTNALKALAAGQCHVAIVNTYYAGRLLKKDPNYNIKVVWPNQKTYGVHINVSGAGIVKGSTNQAEAQKFLEWLSGKSAQESYAQVNMEYSILNDAPIAKEVKSWGDFKRNTSFNLTDAGKYQKEAIKLMSEVGYK